MLTAPRTVEAFAIDRIKDQVVPGLPESCPLPPHVVCSMLEQCPVVLVDPAVQEHTLPFNDANPSLGVSADVALRQVSPDHKRSFDIVSPHLTGQWHDEYGNMFSALSLKGNNFSKPGIMEHPAASVGYVPYGLQESNIIGRVVRASALLRALGVSTEYICGISELKAYPWPTIDGQTDATTVLPLQEYKRRIVDVYWRTLPDDERTMQTLAELYEKFKDMTFYTTLRATDTPYRLGDITDDTNRESLFAHINRHSKEAGEPLDAQNPADVRRYMCDIFAPAMGINLARPHEAGFGHGFTHWLNLTAMGGLVDLDSLYGKPLGANEDPLTVAGRAEDIYGVMRAIETTAYGFSVLDAAKAKLVSHETTIAFLDAYRDEILKRASDPTTAAQELSAALYAVAQIVRQDTAENLYVTDPGGMYGILHSRYAIPTYEYLETVDKQQTAKALESFQATAQAIDFLQTPAVLDQATAAFQDTIESIASYINQDLLEKIVFDEDEGILQDAYAHYMVSLGEHRGEAYQYVRRIAADACATHLSPLLRQHLLDTVPDFAQVTEAMAEQFVEVQSTKALATIAISVDALTEKLFIDAADILKDRAEFYKPESVLGAAAKDSNLELAIHGNHLWRFTKDANREDVTRWISELAVPCAEEPLAIRGDYLTTVQIPKGLKLRELIVDYGFDWLESKLEKGQEVIDLDFTAKPSFIVVVQEREDGTIEHRLIHDGTFSQPQRSDNQNQSQQLQLY
ncbi:MAG TPA: hypothetical protein VLE73_07035 [Candidatus Saccharimonadales bacterium]|nr:hypothetical protein [Candidatus Saccharimonadales bacterium]